MQSPAFERFAGVCAILAGISGFLYSVTFVVITGQVEDLGKTLSGLFLMLGGLLSSAALVAVYGRLRETDASFALWALLLGVIGAVGATVHGGYDLALAINPPGAASPADLPSQTDPRGLLTFGVAGIALVVVSWLMGRNTAFPVRLSYLGYLVAALLLILYLGRLIVLDATSPVIAGPALVAGFLANPAWYVWLGLVLRRQARQRAS